MRCVIARALESQSEFNADFVQPIRTPGAVQGFGILIAVEEDMITGNLVVRQVSEVRLGHCGLLRIMHLMSLVLAELSRAARSLANLSVQHGVLLASVLRSAG